MKILEFFIKVWYYIHGEVCIKKGDAKMNAICLSNYVISLFEARNIAITNLKLQKILYYIQGYFYKRFGKEAFSEDIYNWQYGPVVPVVYYEYNSNGSLPLKSRMVSFADCTITEGEEKLIISIVDKCSGIPTSKLVSMTHSESPWRNSNPGSIISKNNIESYFKHSNPLGIEL